MNTQRTTTTKPNNFTLFLSTTRLFFFLPILISNCTTSIEDALHYSSYATTFFLSNLLFLLHLLSLPPLMKQVSASTLHFPEHTRPTHSLLQTCYCQPQYHQSIEKICKNLIPTTQYQLNKQHNRIKSKTKHRIKIIFL